MYDKNSTPLTTEDKLMYQCNFADDMLRQVRALFNYQNLTYAEVGRRLRLDEMTVKRILNGEMTMTLKRMSHLVRAMNARPEIRLFAYKDMSPGVAVAFDQPERDRLQAKRLAIVNEDKP